MKKIKIEYGKVHQVGERHGVLIYHDVIKSRFFFRVKRGQYEMRSYDYCVEKIDYLKNIGQSLEAYDETGL